MRDKRPKPLTDKAKRKRMGKGFKPVDSLALHKKKQEARKPKPEPEIEIFVPPIRKRARAHRRVSK